MGGNPVVRFTADGDSKAEIVIALLATHGDAPGINRTVESARIDRIPLESLVLTGSPRSSGEDPRHTRRLLEAAGSLPPIVVHRTTMRVVDGFHRVQVARQLGMTEIAARLFDSDDESAFLLGITLNIGHGLPLARADRNAAADQLLRDHPEFSNRMIGSVVGLSDKTIAARRTVSTAENPQLTRRIGRDGRSRPSSSRQSQLAGNELPHEIERALRATEEARGEHCGTRRETKPRRGRLRNEPRGSSTSSRAASPDSAPPTALMIERLKSDPSIRQTEAGRTVLRMLTMQIGAAPIDDRLADGLPTHSLDIVARLAERRAEDLLTFANHLRRRTTNTTRHHHK